MLGLCMRKIKGTPYKVVLSNWNIIGIFDGDKFFSKKGMKEKHLKAVAVWHAGTLTERIEDVK